jgi:hypothetical protein
MRFMVLCLLTTTWVPTAAAQEHWEQLPGAARAYAVDLRSLGREGSILTARIRTHDVGSRLVVQHVQVRCALGQLRTVKEELYDRDTGRPLPQDNEGRSGAGSAWPEYEAGSEGHALLSSLCALAHKRNILAPDEHSLRAA